VFLINETVSYGVGKQHFHQIIMLQIFFKRKTNIIYWAIMKSIYFVFAIALILIIPSIIPIISSDKTHINANLNYESEEYIQSQVSRSDLHAEKMTYKILFIGSSYFNFNNLPYMFENLAKNLGYELIIGQRIPNGWYLDDHANSNETEKKINEKDWDYVILQGGGPNTAYPDYFIEHPLVPALEILKDKIYSNCESTKIVFCLPWAFEDGMTWYDNWTDTFEDMQIKILNNTLKFCQEIGLTIAPVGWSWYNVLEEMNYPLHYLHKSDWNHPSRKGSYLMACTIYSTIFLKSCVGNNYYDSIIEEEAIYFQKIASKTVFDNYSLWNINYENDTTSPYIKIIYPLNGLYLYNNKIMNLTNNIISIGPIEIIVDTSDVESGIDYVEYSIVRYPLFILGQFIDENYTYYLDRISIGCWHVTVRAYDNVGNKAIDQIQIWKFL